MTYANALELEIVATYSDWSISGTSLMCSGTFDVDIFEALDRLNRNQADIAQIYREFFFNGLPIETLSERLISEIHIEHYAHAYRTLLSSGKAVQKMCIDLAIEVRGLLRVFGLRLPSRID